MDGLQHTLDELERIREHGAPHREERDPSAEGNDHPRTPESFGNVDFDDLGKP